MLAIVVDVSVETTFPSSGTYDTRTRTHLVAPQSVLLTSKSLKLAWSPEVAGGVIVRLRPTQRLSVSRMVCAFGALDATSVVAGVRKTPFFAARNGTVFRALTDHTFLSPFTKESCVWTRLRILDIL